MVCTRFLQQVNYIIMEKITVLLNTTCLLWSLSIPLPNIIKICQTIKKLWHTQEFDTEIHSGEVTRKQQLRALSFLHVTPTGPYLCLYQNIIKLFQTIKKLLSALELGFESQSVEFTEKKKKKKQKNKTKKKKKKKKKKKLRKSCPSCMRHSYLTWLMSLPNINKLYHTVFELWSAQDSGEIKIVSLARDTPTTPCLCLYQIL